jgi:hypothetical protein
MKMAIRQIIHPALNSTDTEKSDRGFPLRKSEVARVCPESQSMVLATLATQIK